MSVLDVGGAANHAPFLDNATALKNTAASLYQRLSVQRPDVKTRAEAAAFLHQQIAALDHVPTAQDDAPEAPEDLASWLEHSNQLNTAKYMTYLAARKSGAPRSYFTNRAHALYVVRALAPTKLVDGAWLYGLLRYWENPRYGDLIRIYLEELGDGHPDKNHVALYRSLLVRYGLDVADALPDDMYTQGAMQLAMAWNAEDFLPEVIGFNLGYEQLPLHLLITAHELNELGIDPYYFTLHVTVDNPQTGHALRAVRAVQEALPRLRHDPVFWERVQKGCRLSSAGTGTTEVIKGFDIGQEVLRIFTNKASAGHGVHSDYCRIDGRSVNEWLSEPDGTSGFLSALVSKGWIRLGRPVESSRFWSLLQGPAAEMFGVFSPYELQVIHDWIRGEASSDGRPYVIAHGESENAARLPSYKAQKALAERRERAEGSAPVPSMNEEAMLDPDLQSLKALLPGLDRHARTQLLVDAMAPASHWSPMGLYATRQFAAQM